MFLIVYLNCHNILRWLLLTVSCTLCSIYSFVFIYLHKYRTVCVGACRKFSSLFTFTPFAFYQLLSHCQSNLASLHKCFYWLLLHVCVAACWNRSHHSYPFCIFQRLLAAADMRDPLHVLNVAVVLKYKSSGNKMLSDLYADKPVVDVLLSSRKSF